MEFKQTTEVASWAVDLSTVGPIYPFVGFEMFFFICGLIFWIVFHVWQLSAETKAYNEDMAKLAKPTDVERVMRTQKLD